MAERAAIIDALYDWLEEVTDARDAHQPGQTTLANVALVLARTIAQLGGEGAAAPSAVQAWLEDRMGDGSS